MATFGPGSLPFTGFSPTLGVGDANTPSTSGAVQLNGLIQQDADINRALVTMGNRSVQALFLALLGAVAGGTATATRPMIVGSPLSADSNGAQGGGVVPIQTVSVINRVTTAADVNNLKTLVNFTRAPSTYAPDGSGTGGGSKLGW
jgi:hypothetical protein